MSGKRGSAEACFTQDGVVRCVNVNVEGGDATRVHFGRN